MVAVPASCPVLAPADSQLLQDVYAYLASLEAAQASPSVPIDSPLGPGSAGAFATAGDSLRYTVRTTLASQTVSFRGRLLSPTGSWQDFGQNVVGTSAGSPVRVIKAAAPGWYSNVVASFGTSSVTGTQVHVLVELGRTEGGIFTPYAVLLSGYSTSQDPLDMNLGVNPTSQGGGTAGSSGGCCIPTQYGYTWDPDSTNPFTWTPATGAVARLKYLQFTHTTSAVAGNRYIYLSLGTASWTAFEVSSAIAQGPGVAYDYTFQAEGATVQNAATGRNFFALPNDLWFADVIYLNIQANGVQAGDSYSFTMSFWEEKGP